MKTDLERYKEACDYPSILNEELVEKYLRDYLAALKTTRKIVRIKKGWTLGDYPELKKMIDEILEKIRAQAAQAAQAGRAAQDALDAQAAQVAQVARAAQAALAAQDARDARAARATRAARVAQDALDAQDARDARDARDALVARDARAARVAQDALDARAVRAARDARDARVALVARDARAARAAQDALDAQDARDAQAARDRVACWCISRCNYWFWNWEISWLVTTFLGAKQLGKKKVLEWTGPLFEAFINGVYLLYWTEDVLYWVAKPIVRKTINPRRLHSSNSPAIECDLENLYFWNGILVDEEIVKHPWTITKERILAERNSEVSRVIAERLGWDEYLKRTDTVLVHKWFDEQTSCHYELYDFKERRGSLQPRLLKMESPELKDGTRPYYIEPVPPQAQTCQAAQRWQCDPTRPEVEECNRNPLIDFDIEA